MLLVAALLAGAAAHGTFAQTASADTRAEESVESLALQWFERMRMGKIDRTQLSAAYSAQLTDDAVQGISHYLKEYEYGASPKGAKVLQSRTIGDQTFYVVKLVFPRGDAASLLFGFDAENKITGISLMSMAGD
jgi:hypothetical protein